MANAKQVFQTMKPGCIYRVCDLAAMLQEPTDSVRRMLNVFAMGGVVEELPGDGYRRKKLYTTRQRNLL